MPGDPFRSHCGGDSEHDRPGHDGQHFADVDGPRVGRGEEGDRARETNLSDPHRGDVPCLKGRINLRKE